MHCFITVVTGFIGSTVAERLIGKNYWVSGLTRSPQKEEEVKRVGVDPVVGDMREPKIWISSVQGVDAIIHTATISVPSRLDNCYLKELTSALETVVRSSVEATASCKAFIYTSCMTVYGSGCETKTEESKVDPLKMAEPYGVGEEIVLEVVKKNELPGIILRLGGVYGNGGIFGKYWTNPVSKGKRASYPGNGKQVDSFVSVDDCAQAYVRCIENPVPGEIFNIVDDEPVAFGTLIQFGANKMEASKPFGNPEPIFRILGGKTLADILLTDMIIDNTKMKKELGVELQYPTYREGITALAKKNQNRGGSNDF